MVQPEQLHAYAERIRASGALGRSDLLLRLFNFFIECTLAGRVPKEIEVALDVFGKRADFDVAQDAVVRVYIHKLRRKLDEYYAGPGKEDEERLIIPKGEYRFVLQSHADPAVGDSADAELNDLELDSEAVAEAELEALAAANPPAAPRRWVPWLLGLVAVLLTVNLVVLALRPGTSQAALELQAVRSNPVWAKMLDDNLPIYVVVGDYYIFGELDDSSMEVQRLVREYDINSPTDLEQHLKNNPDLAARYMDLSLRYLPTSTAYALRNVMPLLEPNNKSTRQVQVILASDVTPSMAKSAHIIYIGLLSGMSVLREIVFSGSHLAIGDSYDELLDLQTKKRYVSQASMVQDDRTSYLDYGFFSARTGTDGNELVIIAGTRDVALMHMAETLTNQNSLKQLEKQAGTAQDFEALYSVQALDRTNLDGKLLLSYRFNEHEFANTANNISVANTANSSLSANTASAGAASSAASAH
ncbi:MAG: hypothetical protein QM808_15170 [Steroidobacteraceae bacterium]